jgi:hypothetical protein
MTGKIVVIEDKEDKEVIEATEVKEVKKESTKTKKLEDFLKTKKKSKWSCNSFNVDCLIFSQSGHKPK